MGEYDGDLLTEVGGGEDGVESSGHWRLRREEELGGEKKKHPPGVTP